VQLGQRWLESYIATMRTPDGQRRADARFRWHIQPFFDHKPLCRVTGEDVRSFRLALERKGLATLTVWSILSDVRCFFRWAEDSGYLEHSPWPRRVMPRLQERAPDRVDESDVGILLTAPEPHGFMLRLALGTGMRWSELARAQASDVENGMFVVRKSKSGRVRRIPLMPGLLAEMRGRVGKLFSYTDGDAFARAVFRRTGVKFHPHQLRHTFACRWLEAGGSLAALQEILGHASIVTTQRYARLSEAHVRAEAARLYGVVEETGKPRIKSAVE
jgi:integrase